MREARHPISSESSPSIYRRCTCLPLVCLQQSEYQTDRNPHGQYSFVPVAPPLESVLRTTLTNRLPLVTPLSLLLLHIAQFEHIQMPPTSAIIHKRLDYHASGYLLEQILQHIRRTLRAGDQILEEKSGTGAAILFPLVNEEGVSHIAGRLSHSLNLLQAETITPPLHSETEIVLGFGSHSGPTDSLEELFCRAGLVQERITFRPAVAWGPTREKEPAVCAEFHPGPGSKEVRLREARVNGIPFIQIPSHLPARLQQLVPYALAVKLRCVPVGRDHNRLTVAMVNPRDIRAICRLHEATGMTILPVSCEIPALEVLLASGW